MKALLCHHLPLFLKILYFQCFAELVGWKCWKGESTLGGAAVPPIPGCPAVCNWPQAVDLRIMNSGCCGLASTDTFLREAQKPYPANLLCLPASGETGVGNTADLELTR